MNPYTEPGSLAWEAWHLDGGVSGTVGGTLSITDVPTGGAGMVISGIPAIYNNGASVSAFICGLDFGDYVVQGGQITVPYASDPDKLGTQAYILARYAPVGISNNAFAYWTTPATIGAFVGWLPCVIGFRYGSAMQLTRPASRDATEGRTGAGFDHSP
jgi:hypothetical protein